MNVTISLGRSGKDGENCTQCGAQVYIDDHGTITGTSGGDVCGIDGDNAPHQVECFNPGHGDGWDNCTNPLER